MRSAPLPPDEAERLAALRRASLLDTPPEAAFDDLTHLAAHIAETPIALVSLVDEHRQWFKAAVGLEARETGRDVAFCAHAILTPAPLVVHDALRDERFARNPLVVGPPHIRFYAGFPLEVEGHRLGTLCVIDRRPRELGAAQMDALARLRDRAVATIAARLLLAEYHRLGETGWHFLETTDDLVQIMGEDGRLLYVNAAWRAALGLSVEEARGRQVLDLVAPEDRAACQEHIAQVLRGGRVPSFVVTFVARDGRRLLLEGACTLRPDDRTIRTTFRDATARARAAEELEARVRERTEELTAANDGLRREIAAREEAQRALARAEAELRGAQRLEGLGRLAGGVAHDFNNIMTVIGGHVALLLDPLGAEHPLRTQLLEVQAAADRASALTRQLLAFSRQQVLAPTVQSLNTIVQDVVPMLRRLIREDVKLELRLAPDLPNVRVDVAQMGQVLSNLVVNARDAMPDGGQLTIETQEVTLGAEHVQAHPGATAGPHVRLRVTDTGEGISAEGMAHLFEPFYTTKARGRGTGLGLATVHGIVQQSGGSISVESQVGRGTTFTVHLPAVTAPVEAPPPPPPAAVPTARAQEAVLLVEDEEAVRELTRAVLSMAGYEVYAATCPSEALELVQRGAPIDLMITDVVLPEMNGRQLHDRIAAARPGLKVLYMSGYTEDALVRGLGTGARFIHKPFRPNGLRSAVRALLDGAPEA